jgi:hypothetical protein
MVGSLYFASDCSSPSWEPCPLIDTPEVFSRLPISHCLSGNISLTQITGEVAGNRAVLGEAGIGRVGGSGKTSSLLNSAVLAIDKREKETCGEDVHVVEGTSPNTPQKTCISRRSLPLGSNLHWRSVSASRGSFWGLVALGDPVLRDKP